MSLLQLYGPNNVGVAFDPLAPNPSDIHLETIGHGLSLENRFASHTKSFWPVAMHCYCGSLTIPDPEVALYFALHDAAEGLGWRDFASPVKHRPEMAWYREIEERILTVVARRFDLPARFWMHPEVRRIDERELHLDQLWRLQRPPAYLRQGVWLLSEESRTELQRARLPSEAEAEPTPRLAKELWLGRVAELFAATGRITSAIEALRAWRATLGSLDG